VGSRASATGIISIPQREDNFSMRRTGRRVSRLNPESEWIVTQVPDLRIISDELWEAAKKRQRDIAVQFRQCN
jgi:hypothetical protein